MLTHHSGLSNPFTVEECSPSSPLFRSNTRGAIVNNRIENLTNNLTATSSPKRLLATGLHGPNGLALPATLARSSVGSDASHQPQSSSWGSWAGVGCGWLLKVVRLPSILGLFWAGAWPSIYHGFLFASAMRGVQPSTTATRELWQQPLVGAASHPLQALYVLNNSRSSISCLLF